MSAADRVCPPILSIRGPGGSVEFGLLAVGAGDELSVVLSGVFGLRLRATPAGRGRSDDGQQGLLRFSLSRAA
jgi:hypothetical protein